MINDNLKNKSSNTLNNNENNDDTFNKMENTPVINKFSGNQNSINTINISPLFTIKKNLFNENLITPKLNEFAIQTPINSLIKNINFKDASPFDINKIENSFTKEKNNLNFLNKEIDYFNVQDNNFINTAKNFNEDDFWKIKENSKEFDNEKVKEVKEKKNGCNCTKTRCIKLYCECFRNEEKCSDDCYCTNCLNTNNNSQHIETIVSSIKKKNPNAFSNKKVDKKIEIDSFKGCFCKKTKCLKNYCECFIRNLVCTDKCKCINCKNSKNNKFGKKSNNKKVSNSESHDKYIIKETKKKIKNNIMTLINLHKIE